MTKIHTYSTSLSIPIAQGKLSASFDRMFRGSISPKEMHSLIAAFGDLMKRSDRVFYIHPYTDVCTHQVVIFIDQSCKYVEIFVPDADKHVIETCMHVVATLCDKIFGSPFKIITSSIALTTSENRKTQEMQCAQYIWLRSKNVPLVVAERQPLLSEMFVDKTGLFATVK